MEETPQESREAKVEKLLALLPPSERAKAALILREEEGLSLTLLTNILGREHSRRKWRIAAIAVPGVVLFVLSLLALGGYAPSFFIGLMGLGGLGMIPIAAYILPVTRREKAALETILNYETKASIGPLLEGLRLRSLSGEIRYAIEHSLIRLLPLLTREDELLLTPAQRGQLLTHLNYALRDGNLHLRLATLQALEQIEDRKALGAIFRLATGEAATQTAQTVRTAARESLERMGTALEFGPITRIPEYVDLLLAQMQSDNMDYQGFAVCMLALRQLLPLLTLENYRSILTQRSRERLYQLLVLDSTYTERRYGRDKLILEIIHTASRMEDTNALPSIRKTAFLATKQIAAAAREAIRVLETKIEKEREGKTLLRGSVAPGLLPQELLRPALPAASETAPQELLRAAIAAPETYTGVDSPAKSTQTLTPEVRLQTQRRGGEGE